MKKTVKDTVIKLKKDDAALVIKNNDEMQIFLPTTDLDAYASIGAMTVAIVGMLLDEGDTTLENLIVKRAKKLINIEVQQKKEMKNHGRNKKTISRKVRK